MGEIVRFDTVSQYNAFHQHETLRPLESDVDLVNYIGDLIKKAIS